MSGCWILPHPPQWLIPQSFSLANFHRILAANSCVLKAWGRDYIPCWTALPLTCTSMGKKYHVDSISVKLFFPLEWEEICSQLTEDQQQRAGEGINFGWLKCSGGIFYSSVLNTWITKGRRINAHYTWLSHPPCWTYLATLVICYSCHHAEAFGLYIHKFYQKSFLSFDLGQNVRVELGGEQLELVRKERELQQLQRRTTYEMFSYSSFFACLASKALAYYFFLFFKLFSVHVF